ncbi:hypothetical protein FBUS_04413, partial [Fasciolopsis buskii]
TKSFNLLGDFLEAAINCFLYQRKTYPRVAFSPFNVFGVPIQVCTHPEVKKYIYECVESLRSQFPRVRELRIAIKLPAESSSSNDSEFLESLVIRFDGINEELFRYVCLVLCGTFAQLQFIFYSTCRIRFLIG